MDKILNSKIIGDHPQHLMVIHGLFGQLDNWNTHGKKFGEYFTTHLLDLRNHGRSFHDDEMNFRVMIEDLLRYLEVHGISKAHFLGHSLGGRLVIDLAMTKGEIIDKLIVADMAPKAYPPHHNAIFKALKSVDFSRVESRQDVEEVLKQYIPEVGVRQFLLKNVYHTDQGYTFRFNLEALDRAYHTLVGEDLSAGEFYGPTLFLAGAKSDYLLLEDEFEIKKRFPNAEIDRVSNAGHWLHAENPTEFMAKCLAFLLRA